MSLENYSSDAGGRLNRENKDLNCLRSNEDWRSDLANIQAKKATRRGKMAHVTKIVNNIYKLIENSSAIREVESAIRSLNEAFNGFVIRHEAYVTVLTDEIDIDLATDKLVELRQINDR